MEVLTDAEAFVTPNVPDSEVATFPFKWSCAVGAVRPKPIFPVGFKIRSPEVPNCCELYTVEVDPSEIEPAPVPEYRLIDRTLLAESEFIDIA